MDLNPGRGRMRHPIWRVSPHQLHLSLRRVQLRCHNRFHHLLHITNNHLHKMLSLRYCVERIQHIYDRDNLIMEHSHPKRAIASKRMIDLTGQAGAPNLHASFDRYWLGWMTGPRDLINKLWSGSFMLSTPPYFIWFPHGMVGQLSSHN